jgi:hypothetical protein
VTGVLVPYSRFLERQELRRSVASQLVAIDPPPTDVPTDLPPDERSKRPETGDEVPLLRTH